ncbi:hypothetical protein G6F65_022928 [Rhizopus arrhizus]|nr:hypothetical protein G6F65_022928 [Rhizopus arrhizus]
MAEKDTASHAHHPPIPAAAFQKSAGVLSPQLVPGHPGGAGRIRLHAPGAARGARPRVFLLAGAGQLA